MCGRFANGLSYDTFVDAVRDFVPDESVEAPSSESSRYHPTYNVAPGVRYPVVHTAASSSSLLVETMKWGLMTDDVRPGTTAHQANHFIINSRDDAIADARSFWRPLINERRCIVFCQGYYEWHKVHNVGKPADSYRRIAHFVGMQEPGLGRRTVEGAFRRLMPMAALWTEGRDGVRKFTIVTTSASKQLEFLHDRMPVVLSTPAECQVWLDTSAPWAQVAGLLHPYRGTLECYKVPPEVGTVGVSRENMIQPLEARKDGLRAMFSNAAARSKAKSEREPEDVRSHSGVKCEPAGEFCKAEFDEDKYKSPVEDVHSVKRETEATLFRDTGRATQPFVSSAPRSSSVKDEAQPIITDSVSPRRRGPSHVKSSSSTPRKRQRKTAPSSLPEGTPSLTSMWSKHN